MSLFYAAQLVANMIIILYNLSKNFDFYIPWFFLEEEKGIF